MLSSLTASVYSGCANKTTRVSVCVKLRELGQNSGSLSQTSKDPFKHLQHLKRIKTFNVFKTFKAFKAFKVL